MRARVAVAAAVVAGVLLAGVVAALVATGPLSRPTPTPAPPSSVLYRLPDDLECLKGRGNCVVYPKSARLPGGHLVAAFERATVARASGGAVGETLPIYGSDDGARHWRLLTDLKPPAELSDDPRFAPYTSNWTNPYLYVLPTSVGDLATGTLLLASVVSGEDEYFSEHKEADPGWTATNDGDRRDMALALFSSTDGGSSWRVLTVIATGGWQGGSAGAAGADVSTANVDREVDPVWEPYLLAWHHRLIVYYSDEDEYLGSDPATGVAVPDPQNSTAPDPRGQVLVHTVWDGTPDAGWSRPVIDAPGTAVTTTDGRQVLGGGRPGMANVVPTRDGRWMMTFEYWGGGESVRYKLADDPLSFGKDPSPAGRGISDLPVGHGSHPLAEGGSPVLVRRPDGSLIYNAAGSGHVWVNPSGRSSGTWREDDVDVPAGYSRDLQPLDGSNVLIIRSEDSAVVSDLVRMPPAR